MMAPLRLASAVALLVPMVAGCSSTDGKNKVDSAPKLHVIFDYSPTLSDAGALLYLASNSAVELLAVTLPGTGEADCEPGIRATRSLLTLGGHGDVAIGCGRNTPLEGDRDWPEEWLKEVSRWEDLGLLPGVAVEPVLDAEQLLADTLDAASAPVTLIAVGPLTNIGAVLGDRPELADKIERIVIMGGAVTVPGNVEASPAAEWNIYIDPEAGRRVIAAGVAVWFVPLDATNYLPWTDRLLSQVTALGTPAADTVHQLAKARDTIDGVYLWDELAAMVAVVPGLITFEAMTVRIDDDGALVRDPDGFPVEVAVSTDTDAAIQEFLDTLNGSPVSAAVPLTPAELEYFVTMGGVDSNASASFSRLYGGFGDTEADPRTQAAAFINGFLDSTDALASDLRKVSPPAALVSAHDGYVESLANLASVRSDLLAQIAASKGATLDEILFEVQKSVTDPFDRVGETCQILVDYSFLHDGPRPCNFE